MPFSFDPRGVIESTLLTILMFAIAVFAPLFGMGLAAIVFFDRLRRGHRTMRNMAFVALVLATVSLFTPVVSLGRFGPVA